ncbi:MAG: phytoene desaturase family protein [Aureispira sp.]
MSNKDYDIAIIGSGLSGLICGYILSKEGYKVVLLEKNKQVGGCLQTFARDKRIFDVGVHYIGGLAKGQSLHQYFTYLGIMEQLNVEQLESNAFDVIRFGNSPDYALAQGWERFVGQLTQQFPQEQQGLKAYQKAIRESCAQFPLYNLDIDRAYPKDLSHLGINAQQKIAHLIQDPTLRAVLGGNNLLYAGKGTVTPFHLHALVLNSYIESAWRCVDGGSQIARALVKNIRANGGTLHKKKEVDHFTFETGKIKEIVLNTGETIGSKAVICSAHPAQLSRFVRHEKGVLRKAYLNRIQQTNATPAVFSAHYTLKPNTVPYTKSNYYQHSDQNVWEAVARNKSQWPGSYLALTPRSSKSAIYADSFAALTYMDYETVKPWANSFNTTTINQSRGANYEDFKQAHGEQLLQLLYKRFPELKGNVLESYASTPLSFRDYTGAPTGSFYGFERDYNDPMRTALAVKTRIPNLTLTGQNINMHGILGVTVSAVLACLNFIDRKKLLTDIVKAS